MNKYKVIPTQPMDNWLIVQRDSSVATQPVYTDEGELILGRSTLHVLKYELNTNKKYTVILDNKSGNANFGLANSNTNPTTYPSRSMGTANGYTEGVNIVTLIHNGTYWELRVNGGTAWEIPYSNVKYIIFASNTAGGSVEAMKIRTILEE